MATVIIGITAGPEHSAGTAFQAQAKRGRLAHIHRILRGADLLPADIDPPGGPDKGSGAIL